MALVMANSNSMQAFERQLASAGWRPGLPPAHAGAPARPEPSAARVAQDGFAASAQHPGLLFFHAGPFNADLAQAAAQRLRQRLDELDAPRHAKERLLRVFSAMARRDNLSLRQLYQKVISARGHWTLVGTPVQIADQLEHWFQTGAADGFNVMGPTLPHGLSDFIEGVLPELRRRGLFRTEYTGRTLREHLGLPRPAHPAVLARQAIQATEVEASPA